MHRDDGAGGILLIQTHSHLSPLAPTEAASCGGTEQIQRRAGTTIAEKNPSHSLLIKKIAVIACRIFFYIYPMKNLAAFLLILFAFTAYSQKTFLDFRNESTPTYPGCENAENKEDCYRQKVGELVLEKVNSENAVNAFKQDRIEIQLMIRNEVSGNRPYSKLKQATRALSNL